MVDRVLKLYEGIDLSPETDLTGMVKWEAAEFGTRAHRGEATSSNVIVEDVDGRIGEPTNLPAGLTPFWMRSRNVVELQHGSNVLWRGRVATKDWSRGPREVGRYRQSDTYLEDINIDLRGLPVINWVRPAETDVARVQVLVADYLSGNVSPDRRVNGSNLVNAGSNVVTLPAKTYTRMDVQGVLTDIADQANKTYFLLPRRRTTDAHFAELFYDGNDAVMERCPYRITDRVDEVRAAPSHHFYPIWNVGSASIENGQETLSGVWLFYGTDSYVHVTDPVLAGAYSFWEEVIFDDSVTTEEEARSKAQSILDFRKNEEETYNVTIGPLTDAEIGSIRAGQTIAIKARAIPVADDAYTDRRISQLKITSPVPHLWFAHMQLGRPWRMGPYAKGSPVGPKPPSTPTTPSVVSSDVNTGSGDAEFTALTVTEGQGIVAFFMSRSRRLTGVSWQPTLDNGDDQVLTMLGEHEIGVSGTDPSYEVWWIGNPTPSANGTLAFNAGSADRELWAYVIVNTQDTPTVVEDTGTTETNISTAYTAGTADLILSLIGWVQARAGTTLDTVPGTQTILEQTVYGLHAGRELTYNATHRTGGASVGYTLAEIPDNWAHYVLVFPGTAGSSPEPVGDDSDPGDDTDTFSPIDHVHAHGDRSSSTATEHSADSIEVTPFSTIAATNVQDALEEIVSEVAGGGAPTNADYLVGTANGSLSNEIVVGTTPGGELGGTWASPTVDATHAGSTHDAATNTHIADATDAHDASAISYDNTASGMTATDVQDAIDELDAAISAGGIPATIVDAKGDLIVGTAADTVDNLTVGANGSTIVAASGETTGLKWRLNNDAAGAAPTANDDSGDGYSVGSRWIDTTNDKEYVCLDATATAAVWKETTATGGGGLTQAYVGYNTVGGSTEQMTSRRHYVRQITLANDCLLTDIEAYVYGETPSDQDLKFGIWTDSSGSPNLLIQAAVPGSGVGGGVYLQENVAADGAARWFGAALGRWLVAGTYWIGVVSEGAAQASIYYDASGADKIWTATVDDITSAVPATWTITDSTRHYSIRANTIR